MKKIILSALLLTAGCALNPQKWNSSNLTDEFTGVQTCRVEFGTPHQRAMDRSVYRTYMAYSFFAENRDGEIRAGFQTEPAIPVQGDIQVKVGDKVTTLTAANTPIDMTASMPANTGNKFYDNAMASMTKTIQQAQSPYRALTGAKAKKLLREMSETNEPVRFRVIGVNAALSATGTLITDATFNEKLKACNIQY